MDMADNTISSHIEVVPVVVVSQTFPARPSSIPDIRDFVRQCLAQSPVSEPDNREIGETVSRALLDPAGPVGAISVSYRIFPDHVEVDVLKSGPQLAAPSGLDALTSLLRATGAPPGTGFSTTGFPTTGFPTTGFPTTGLSTTGLSTTGLSTTGLSTTGLSTTGLETTGQLPVTGPDADATGPDGEAVTESFAEWMSALLRRQGLTLEAAARQLGVSVKTVSRWVGGATEPRLRDLRRIHELFGEIPFP
jgi:hypothetical protein